MFRLVLVSKAFRYRVYPTQEQVARLNAWESALRFLWNLALEQRKLGLARPRDERRYPTAFDQINELTELRAALPWLADVPRNVCSQLLVELDRAWQRCFAKLARAPRWKRQGPRRPRLLRAAPEDVARRRQQRPIPEARHAPHGDAPSARREAEDLHAQARRRPVVRQHRLRSWTLPSPRTAKAPSSPSTAASPTSAPRPTAT